MTRLQRALELIKQNKRAEARQLLELLLKENPNEVDVLYNLGMLYTDSGETKRAVELLERCVGQSPDYANALVALGLALHRTGQSTRAREVLERALKLEPDNPYAHRNLGGLLGHEREYRPAIEHLQKALARLPEDPQSLYGLGLCLFRLEEYNDADPYLKRYLDLGRDQPMAGLAEDMRREIANHNFRSQGLRPDAILYCLGALDLFKAKPDDFIRDVTFEIALLGQGGLDITNAERKYTLKSLPGQFSGLHLVCIMYVGFRRIDPSVDIGMDVAREYVAARNLFDTEATRPS